MFVKVFFARTDINKSNLFLAETSAENGTEGPILTALNQGVCKHGALRTGVVAGERLLRFLGLGFK